MVVAFFRPTILIQIRYATFKEHSSNFMNQEVYFTNIRKHIIENLRNCHTDLKIAVAWFTDKNIISEVNELIKRGVKVQVIIYDDHVNQKELFKELYYSKAKIFLSKKLMHNKFCIIDNQTVINGSYNWTINASTNEENIQVTYDNKDFAERFTNQFDKLSLACKNIDNHFEYSLTNLEEQNFEYERFYANWSSYNYPYFINTLNLKVSETNKFSKVFGHIYLIKNEKEEKDFLWYYYFLKTKYSVSKIKKIIGNKNELPQKFEFIHNCVFDKNNASNFKQNNYIVEEHNIKSYSAKTRYYLYSINKSGELTSEKHRYTFKVSDSLYIMHLTSLQFGLEPHFINSTLRKTKINYYVMRVLSNNFMIVSNSSNTTQKIGILNTNNKIVIPFNFGNWVREPKEDYVELVEFPFCKKIKSENRFWKLSVDYNTYKQKGHVIYRYSIPDFALITRYNVIGIDDEDEDEYLFLSDENYKYKDFYNDIDSRISDISPSQLDELKKHYLNKNKVNLLLEKFATDRLRLQEIKRLETKKKEGCYIATMVYGNYNHPNVIYLRNFRDNILNKNNNGKKFIKIYYKYSPKYVAYVYDKKILNFISKILIKIIEIGIKTWHNN
jgi:hypothetical protein